MKSNYNLCLSQICSIFEESLQALICILQITSTLQIILARVLVQQFTHIVQNNAAGRGKHLSAVNSASGALSFYVRMELSELYHCGKKCGREKAGLSATPIARASRY